MPTLTVLYTGDIRGQLGELPRYATFLQHLRGQATGRVLLLDTGNACDDDAAPCRLTHGRAVPIVLDAMNYDAIHVGGYLPAASREALRANHLSAALVDQDHPVVLDGVAYAAAPPAAQPHQLHIALATSAGGAHLSEEPVLNGIHTLTLGTVRAGQVGEVLLELNDKQATLKRAEMHRIPTHTRPAATISGTVEFVMEEVRFLRRTQR